MSATMFPSKQQDGGDEEVAHERVEADVVKASTKRRPMPFQPNTDLGDNRTTRERLRDRAG